VLRLEDADDPVGWQRSGGCSPIPAPAVAGHRLAARSERLVRQARQPLADALLDWPVAAVGAATAAAVPGWPLADAVGQARGSPRRELLGASRRTIPVVLACARPPPRAPEALAAAGHPVHRWSSTP